MASGSGSNSTPPASRTTASMPSRRSIRTTLLAAPRLAAVSHTGAMVAADRFVGRQAQLAEITAAARAVHDGRAGVFLVSGEAGIGKTRLVHEATASAPGPTVWATCWDGDGAPAFWPWIQVIRGCLARPGGQAWR